MTRTRYILLVDDNDNDVQLALMALGQVARNAQIEVVHDGAEALDYLYCRGGFETRLTPTPDVILLDLKMPRVDGLEVLRQVKDDSRLSLIPVVMLSSSREERDIVTSYRLGANAYVVKPVDFTEFLDAINTTASFWTVRNEVPSKKGISPAVEASS
jgi:CheY-like chemotaxis protein